MKDTVSIGMVVPGNHPALAGHFPGQPVVPAVVLLDMVLAEIRTRGNFVLKSIPAARFLQPVLPEEPVELILRFIGIDTAQTRVSFQGLRAAALAFEGSFIVSAVPNP
jgi:3-hydroxymyristoyl/3-hydroxydecanoyl-(acyl carrier protein) dehydratase